MNGPTAALLVVLGAPLACASAPQPPQPSQPPRTETPAVQPAAQPPTQPEPAPEPPGPAVVQVTRADLAQHYLRVDRLFMDLLGDGPRRIGDELITRYNREFEGITKLFFSGNLPLAVGKLDELAQVMLAGGGKPLPSIGTAISAAVEPPVWWPGSPATPRVRVRSFWTPDIDATVNVTLRWDDGRAGAQGHPSLTRPLEIKKGRAIELDVPLSDFGPWPEGGESWAPRMYVVGVTLEGYRDDASARYCIVPRSLDIARKANEKKLADAAGAHPELASQIRLCTLRNRLLVDYPGTIESAQFLADYTTLLADIDGEIAALGEGRNPYARRVGEIYRPIAGKGTPDSAPVPCVVYAPSAAAGDTPLPVVVALHGAGGDESMFVRGYGGGRLARLAEEKGFILASAQSYKLGGRAEVFDLLVDQLARDYAVDRARIYVVGHSLGAGVTTYLASSRVDAVAGAVCFAGFGRPGPRTAPVLVFAGELDSMIPLATLRTGVKEAAERSLPVELREDPRYGHTLLVGAKLDEAVAWLLSKSLPAPVPAPPAPAGGR